MSTKLQDNLKDKLHALNSNQEVDLQNVSDEWIGSVVMELLEEDRLFGEVLIQIPRAYDFKLNGMMGINWKNDQIQLIINPSRLSRLQRSQDLLDLLKHEVLHLVWQHPLRYANVAHQNNVTMATDVAVNQYLTDAPADTMTKEELTTLIGKQVPTHEDSQRYLKLIENADFNEDASEIKQRLDHEGEAVPKAQDHNNQTDVHLGWEEMVGQDNLNEQTANLQQMLSSAWKNVPDKQRGLLPGDIIAQLESIEVQPSLNWKALIKQSLGKMPLGRRNSYSRFNRRQPVRMDLPGKITNLVINIDVFIDNSGSMGEKEIAYLLNELRGLLAIYDAKIDVYSFDTIVHEDHKYTIEARNQINFERVGGGGTSFQSIFGYLHRRHANNDSTLAIILTDGWGESKLQTFHFSNVLWILSTAVQELSVKKPIGKVSTLVEDENYQRLVGKK